jgi:hypothetical protein
MSPERVAFLGSPQGMRAGRARDILAAVDDHRDAEGVRVVSETIHGACLCGEIRFEVREPEGMGFCHCTRCQRWSGGPGLPEVEVAATNFKVTRGRELMKHYDEEGFSGFCFCGNCGSSLYAAGGEKYYVCAGVLQDVKLEPTYHMMVAYKAPWDEISGTAPQFPEFPPDT